MPDLSSWPFIIAVALIAVLLAIREGRDGKPFAAWGIKLKPSFFCVLLVLMALYEIGDKVQSGNRTQEFRDSVLKGQADEIATTLNGTKKTLLEIDNALDTTLTNINGSRKVLSDSIDRLTSKVKSVNNTLDKVRKEAKDRERQIENEQISLAKLELSAAISEVYYGFTGFRSAYGDLDAADGKPSNVPKVHKFIEKIYKTIIDLNTNKFIALDSDLAMTLKDCVREIFLSKNEYVEGPENFGFMQSAWKKAGDFFYGPFAKFQALSDKKGVKLISP